LRDKQKGTNNWFVGNVETARTSAISFDFLQKGKKYTATIYADATDAHYKKTNPQAYTIKEERRKDRGGKAEVRSEKEWSRANNPTIN
jgi:hypothetical protein